MTRAANPTRLYNPLQLCRGPDTAAPSDAVAGESPAAMPTSPPTIRDQPNHDTAKLPIRPSLSSGPLQDAINLHLTPRPRHRPRLRRYGCGFPKPSGSGMPRGPQRSIMPRDRRSHRSAHRPSLRSGMDLEAALIMLTAVLGARGIIVAALPNLRRIRPR